MSIDFYELSNQQGIADAIKGSLDQSDESKRAVNNARAALNLFEACDWQPRVFEPLADELGEFWVDDNKAIKFQPSESWLVCKTVIDLLLDYIREVGVNRPLTTNEAAVYLGISPRGVRYHVYESESLAGKVIGNTLFFEQAVLDEFANHKRPSGRPPSRDA